MDIRPIGGSGAPYPKPNESNLASQMREGIAEFSKSIGSGNPDSEADLETLAASITNLHALTEKV